jgi:hypothetical protein
MAINAIDLVSRAATIDLVSPVIDMDTMMAVCSPPSSTIDIPISMMVVAAATDLATSTPSTTQRILSDEEFPPLPSLGEEVMDAGTAAARHAEKEKRQVLLSTITPPPKDPHTPDVLSPIDVDATTFGAAVTSTIMSALLDADLGSFFDSAVADANEAALAQGVQASLANVQPTVEVD